MSRVTGVVVEPSEASQARLPQWENDLIDEAIEAAQRRLEAETAAATKRARQLAREKAYHRLAAAIDRPQTHDPNQLRLFDEDLRLFDDAG